MTTGYRKCWVLLYTSAFKQQMGQGKQKAIQTCFTQKPPHVLRQELDFVDVPRNNRRRAGHAWQTEDKTQSDSNGLGTHVTSHQVVDSQ